jgi:hypothetical protein
MRIIAVFFASWAAGLAAYIGALALFYRQSISSGDFSAVLFWSLAAFAPAFFAVYLPALLGMRRLLRGVRPLWPFPLVAVLLGVIPTALIVFVWGGGVRALLSPEASLFHSMFAAAGVVAGCGFALSYRSDRAA